MRLVKQGYGTLEEERGMLIGVYGKSKEEIARMLNLLYNFGVTDTKVDSESEVSQGLGFWSNQFAVILTNETRLHNFLIKNGIRRIQKRINGKGRKGGLLQFAKIFAQNRFDNIAVENMLPNIGIEKSELANGIHIYETAKIEDNMDLPMTDRELPPVISNWEKELMPIAQDDGQHQSA